MSWEEEKSEYISKLGRIVSGSEKILGLPSNRIVTSDIHGKLAGLRENAARLKRKLEKNEFEIAVVGLEKAGKSSFSNALASVDVLPTADARCTYTTTCIRPGDSNYATVTFYTESEINRDLQEKLKLLGIPDADKYSLDNLELEKYAQLFENCSDDKKERYGDTINEDIRELLANKTSIRANLNQNVRTFSEAEMNEKSFKDMIVNPARALAVKDIVIYSTYLKGMPNAVLYDVPGFDSPTDMHRKQTEQKMLSADAIIAVANAKAPSLTKTSLDIFAKPDSEGGKLQDKLFVFANKADMINDKAALEQNRQTTLNEWIVKRHILSPELEDRITFGSAFAANGDADAQDKMRRLELADGIQIMRDKLEHYSKTTRFEVLKKRIDKILYDVNDLFDEAQKNFRPSSGDSAFYDVNKIVLELMDRLRPELDRKLDTLKYDQNQEMDAQKPLTKDIRERILKLVTEENYGLKKEEREEMHRANVGIGSAEQPNKLDHDLRKNRFDKMYKAFCDQVQGAAADRHKGLEDKIKTIFMESLGVGPDNSAYEELARKVSDLCQFETGDENAYYASLLERFARDIFEILIMYAHGSDRRNKFREELANFISLGVYYEPEEKNRAAQNPLESVCWRMLLYPELSRAPSLDDAVEYIKQRAGLPQVGPGLQKELARALASKGTELIPFLDSAFQKLPKGANEAVISGFVKTALQSAASEPLADLQKLLDEGYVNDVTKKQQDYDYDMVGRVFNDDIHALAHILYNAFVPAVNMEKAFSVRQTRHIEEIKQRLHDEAFIEFIAGNADLIESAKLGEIRQAEARRRADEAVMNEINMILKSVNGAV